MGPCRTAFSQRMAITVRNAGTEPDPDGARLVLRTAGFQAGMSVPVELHGGPIGSLDLYSAQPGTGTTARSAPSRPMPASSPTCSAAPPQPTSRVAWPTSCRPPPPTAP
jgi:GAF domain-containing protein